MSEDTNDEQPGAPARIDVILASSSPRRRDLLEQAGVTFTVRTPQTPVDETLEPDDWSEPEEACKKLAERKAGSIVQEVLAEDYVGTLVVIGADTMVVKDDKIFGKPQDAADAKCMLSALSGATHDVITAVSIWMVLAPEVEDVSIACRTFTDISHVTFKNLSDADIDRYLSADEWSDKAGAYAVQGQGCDLIDHYEGAFDTIVGLPVGRLMKDFPELFGSDHPDNADNGAK